MSSEAREVILQIIEMYKDMPFLWDKEHKKYKDRESRNYGNNVLLEIYKQIDNKATVKTLTKKLQNLRTGYYKELKKVNAAKRNKTGKIYKPTLWYYDALSFLEDSCEPCQSRDPLDTDEDMAASSLSETDMEQSSTSQKFSKQSQKKKRILKERSHPRHDHTLEIDEKSCMKEEEWEILGKCIGIQLRDLDKTQLTIAQKLISDTIYYARMGQLSENSCISLGPSNTVSFQNTLPSTSCTDTTMNTDIV